MTTPIVSFVSQKGGAGKSSLAYAYAWEMQKRHGPTLIVDMDDPQLSLAKNAAIAKEKGFDPPRVECMGLEITERLPRLAKEFAAVVIDTPGRSGPHQRAAMVASTAVFVPVVFDGMHTLAIEDTLEALAEARRVSRGLRAAIIITQQMPRAELSDMARNALKKTGLPVLRTEVFSRTAWRNANAAHLALGVEDPWCRAAEELRALTDDIEKFIKGTTNG
jgi:chromosome partitioning protein